MNIKKILAAGVLALGAIGLMAGCGGDQKSAGSAAKSAAAGAKPTKIVAGMDDTFAPMGFRDDSGKMRYPRKSVFRLNSSQSTGLPRKRN